MSLLRILELRDFRRLWIGQAVSQFGDALYGLLFLFMVDKLTGQAAMVGYVGALESLPFVLFSPTAGAIADRMDRRRVMLTADVVSAVVLVGLSGLLLVNPTPPIAIVFVAACSLALVNTFFAPAKSAAIPALVPADRLMEANALSSATQSMMPLFGLALSGTVLGLLYKLYPHYFFFAAALLNALTFLFSAANIARLPRLLPKHGEAGKKSALHDILEGFRFLRADAVLSMTLVLNFFFHLCIAPFMVVYIAVNRAWFGGQFGTLAMCEASFMLAMVVSSLVVGRRRYARPTHNYIWGWSLAGLTVVAMAFSRPFWLFAFWNVICGLIIPFAALPLETYVQLRVPDAFRGRVNSAMRMAQRGVAPVAMGLAGWLLDRLGPTKMFLIMGAGISVSALVGLASRPFRTATLSDAGDQPDESAETLIPSQAVVSVSNDNPNTKTLASANVEER